MDAFLGNLPLLVEMDYFDWKNLAAANRSLQQSVKSHISAGISNIENNLATRLYACLYGHYVNVFPSNIHNLDRVMGVKIRFFKEVQRNRHPIQYSNLTLDDVFILKDTYIKESFVLGISCMHGCIPRYYFGNQNQYHCVSASEISSMKDTISDMIKSSCYCTKDIDIIHENINPKTLNDFLSQLTQILASHGHNITLSLHDHTIAENCLITHSRCEV